MDLQVEERNDLADQLALLGQFLGRLITAERTAGDVDLALLADDDVKRLFVVTGLRPVQDELVIDQACLDAARLPVSARNGFDILLEEFPSESRWRKLEPLAPLVVLLQALAGKLGENFCPALEEHVRPFDRRF